MGTSKSFPTPSGGKWTPLKKDITNCVGGDRSVSPSQIVGGAVRALGGIRSFSGSGSGGSSGGGGGSRGGKGVGART